ncbi:MAG: hypothetical protein O2964_14745 [Verrucomicrobia bacterium]|nr:hypothetical protein [Verrucomicrobiota bacterium]
MKDTMNINDYHLSRLLYAAIISCFCTQANIKTFAQTQSLLFDFGGGDNQTARPPVFWNNVDADKGSSFFDNIPISDTEGNDTGIALLIDQLFEAAPNADGTTGSSTFPASASSDSLIRNSGGASLAIIGTEGSSDTYTLTFYASDTTATDNRETQYRVAGATTKTVSLNPSGNVNNTIQAEGIGLDGFGEILITLTKGSNHAAGNDTIYLGVLGIESSAGWAALIDFGANDATTTVVADGESIQWNNFTGTVGQTDDGIFEGVVSTKGNSSNMYIEMLSRFNGVNQSGTSDSGIFPATATSDSLFGNVEVFSGLEDILPSFIIGGLDDAKSYDITFYASRLAGDNRETLYTLTGASTAEVALNVADNIAETVTAAGVQPNSLGEIQVDMTPGPKNNNANHFIYLGVLKIESPSENLTYLFDFGGGTTTEIDVQTEPESWNNVEESIGLTNDGKMERLISTEFIRTNIGLEMVSRFNGVNRAGLQTSTLFPASATADSLFGNTEPFGGQENVFPAFKLTGLDADNAYDFTFFGSREAGDNRETRYTVTGTNSKTGDLNVASNADGTVTVSNIRPDANKEILIEMGPGPNNTNGNHFTYLGAMRVDWQPSFKPQILIDAGGTDFATVADADGNIWNNFQGSVGQTDNGMLSGLLAVNGVNTGFGIQMLARFNGVNQAGTTEAAPYPTTVTQDSLFGNSEEWSGLVDVFPSFQLTGLDPATAYTLTFYGSRNATDNRETEYKVTGSNESIIYLNVAGNIDSTAIAENMKPSSDGTITIHIAPGPNNDNGNHFTYLGALQIDWEGGLPGVEEVSISSVSSDGGNLKFTVHGKSGQTYTIQSTEDFMEWTDAQTITLNSDSGEVQLTADQPARFFRVIR